MSSLDNAIDPLLQWRAQLEQTFSLIFRERMQGVPVINSNLEIDARYLMLWNEYYLGVLITPWFMNLILLPGTQATIDQFSNLNIGSKQTHSFPSGHYEFIVGDEAGIGRYQSCSLFSPMFDFADQQAALDTAESVLQELMQLENKETIDSQPGKEQTQSNTAVEEASSKPSKMRHQVNRRELFTNLFKEATDP